MTQFAASIGGPDPTAGIPRGRPTQDWRQSQFAQRESGIDWEKDEKYFSPQPAPKQTFGKYKEPLMDIPYLRERKIRVRAVPPATYYTADGDPIPADEWVTLPISPSLLHAIKEGDLERGEDPPDDGQPEPRHRERARHRAHHQPTPPKEA